MKAVPHELITAICDHAGVQPDDVQAIVITPGRVVITALCRDDNGSILMTGVGEDARVASSTIELPHTPFPTVAEVEVMQGAVVGVMATADAEVIRAADLEAMVNGDADA